MTKSQRWKDLERDTAKALNGRRVTEPWFLFNERPDVIVDMPQGRIVCECKAYRRHAHHRHVEKCKTIYCDSSSDVPCLITREPGKPAYATLPLDFLSTLLNPNPDGNDAVQPARHGDAPIGRKEGEI